MANIGKLGEIPPKLEEAFEAVRAAPVFAYDIESTSFNPFRGKIEGFSVAVDTELVPLQCVNNCCQAPQVPKAWYFQFLPEISVGQSNEQVLAQDPARYTSMVQAFRLFGEVWKNPDKQIVLHNAKFDWKFTHRAGYTIKNQIVDTAIAAWVLDENRGTFKLKDLVRLLLGHDMVQYAELKGLFSPPIELYGADDACQTLRLFRYFQPELKAQGLEKVFYELECTIPEILARMELKGAKVDIEFLEKLRDGIHQEAAQVETECYALAGRELAAARCKDCAAKKKLDHDCVCQKTAKLEHFDLGSTQEVAKLLFGRLAWKPRGEMVQTKAGFYSTDRGTLERYETDKPLAEKILHHRELTKLEGTYLNNLIQAAPRVDGRVHSLFHQVSHPRDGGGGTVTGRLSSSADEELGGTQLQNIPARSAAGRKIREAFVAEDGHVLCLYDFSQIELRIMAHFCQDPTLLDAYQHWICGACKSEGLTEVVLHFCPKCNAPDEQLVNGKHKKGKISAKGEPTPGVFCLGLDLHQITADVCGVDRNLGKIINFALLYGLGPAGLAAKLKCSLSVAKRIHAAYFRKYPYIGLHNERVRKFVVEHGYAITLLKRRRRFPHIKGQKLELWDAEWRMSANYWIQGSAADLMKVSMRNIQRRLEREGLADEIVQVMSVHDELICEVPLPRQDHALLLMRDEMEHALKLRVPVVAEGGAARAWGLAKG